MFDTNIYISFIRDRSNRSQLHRRGTVKYLSSIVLMELWAGSRTKKAKKLINQLQKPYMKSGRLIALAAAPSIDTGQLFADLPSQYDSLIKHAGPVNDVYLAFTTHSIGAVLYTEDKNHFQIIKSTIPARKIEYV